MLNYQRVYENIPMTSPWYPPKIVGSTASPLGHWWHRGPQPLKGVRTIPQRDTVAGDATRRSSTSKSMRLRSRRVLSSRIGTKNVIFLASKISGGGVGAWDFLDKKWKSGGALTKSNDMRTTGWLVINETGLKALWKPRKLRVDFICKNPALTCFTQQKLWIKQGTLSFNSHLN